jgi:hypothetical protein
MALGQEPNHSANGTANSIHKEKVRGKTIGGRHDGVTFLYNTTRSYIESEVLHNKWFHIRALHLLCLTVNMEKTCLVTRQAWMDADRCANPAVRSGSQGVNAKNANPTRSKPGVPPVSQISPISCGSR